jgi:hypothetical protein
LKLVPIAAAVLALALPGSEAAGQQGKSLRDQLVGTWQFVVAEVTASDGKKSFPFGETPKGILIFTPDGHFAQIHVARRGQREALRDATAYATSASRLASRASSQRPSGCLRRIVSV